MKNLNYKIKNIILNWIKEHDLSTCHHKQAYFQKLYKLEFYSDKIAGASQNFKIDDEIFKKDYENFNLFSTKKEWVEKGFTIEAQTQKLFGQDLLDKIYRGLDAEEKILFLAITPRIVNSNNLYIWLKKDIKIFSDFITEKPPAFIEMPSHQEFFKLLSIFNDFYKTDYDELLYKFALSRSKVLRRLETQTILRGFIEKYAKNKSKFEFFYSKIEETDYYLSDIRTITLNISKNAFYNAMNPGSNPLDKQTVTSFLINFIDYINAKEKNRMMCNKIYLLNTDSSVSYYTIVLDIKKESSIDYAQLIDFVMDKSKTIIGKRETEDMFKAAISNYFLSLKLPLKNTQEIAKNYKI